MSNTVGDITMLAEGQSYSGLNLCDSVDGLYGENRMVTGVSDHASKNGNLRSTV